MGNKKGILFGILILVAAAIYYVRKTSSHQPVQKQSITTDSIAARPRPSFGTQKDTMPTPEPVGENLAPGTALIRARIQSITQTDNLPAQITVLVDEVMGYGSSTPPLAKGSTLSFKIEAYLKNNPEFVDSIKKKADVLILVAHQQGLQVKGAGETSEWGFLEFKQPS